MIYYHMESATKAMHYKAKHAITLKPDPTCLDACDLILLLNLLRPWTVVCAPDNRPFQLEYSKYRTECCICSFSAQPCYLNKTMSLYQNNTVATDILFSTYFVFSKTLFDYSRSFHQISHDLELEQTLMLLTSDISSFDLPGLNVNIFDRPFSRHIPIHGKSEKNSNVHTGEPRPSILQYRRIAWERGDFIT